MKFLPAFSSEESARFLYLVTIKIPESNFSNETKEGVILNTKVDLSALSTGVEEKLIAGKQESEVNKIMKEEGVEAVISKAKEDKKWGREIFLKKENGEYYINDYGNSELQKNILVMDLLDEDEKEEIVNRMIKEGGFVSVVDKIKTDRAWALSTFTENLGGGEYQVNFYGNKDLEKHISLFDLLPPEKKYVQIQRTLAGFSFSGDIGVRTKVSADDKSLGGIGYQNLNDFGGARNTLKIGKDTVFRVIDDSEEIKQILKDKKLKGKDVNKKIPTIEEEGIYEQKRTRFLTAISFGESVVKKPEWRAQVAKLSAERQAEINVLFGSISADIFEKVKAGDSAESRQILTEQFSSTKKKLNSLARKAETEEEEKAIENLITLVQEEESKFYRIQKDLVALDYDKLKNKLPESLSLKQAQELFGYIRANEENLNPELVLGLVHKMGLSEEKEKETAAIVVAWFENKNEANFIEEIEEKSEIADLLNEIYSDKLFLGFIKNHEVELLSRGIKTGVDDILETGNAYKLRMFVEEKEANFPKEDFARLISVLKELEKVEDQNSKLNFVIQKREENFKKLQNVVDDLQKDPEKFWKESHEEYEQREAKIGPIRQYFGSVEMTLEEKKESDDLLAELPADVAVSESLGDGRFLVNIGNSDAKLILDFQKHTMSPEKMPDRRKKYLEFPLDSRYLPGLQTVAAMQNVMFSRKESFARKMEDLDGPESLAKLFFVLFYPRNDVLTEIEENRYRTFGENLHKNGKTFFDFLAEFKKPPIIDNGRIWAQAVPTHKADILKQMKEGKWREANE